eukprot:349715-Chlamydomonas_euryale.AAC.6
MRHLSHIRPVGAQFSERMPDAMSGETASGGRKRRSRSSNGGGDAEEGSGSDADDNDDGEKSDV